MPDWKWLWFHDKDPDYYNAGGPDRETTRQIALERVEPGTSFTVCEGRPHGLSDDIFDADDVIEKFHDHNEEFQDEDGSLRMDDATCERRMELVAALNETFRAWREKYELGRAWTLETRNEQVETAPLGGSNNRQTEGQTP